MTVRAAGTLFLSGGVCGGLITMKTPKDLFEHELKDMYDAESKLVDALQQQASESKTTAIKEAFRKHLDETKGQKERLEKVFKAVGLEVSRGQGCAGMSGLLDEHETMKQENPAPEILDTFNLTAAAKVERYEITAYESLINLATVLGKNDAVDLLKQNLQEEQNTLEKVQSLMKSENPIQKIAKKSG